MTTTKTAPGIRRTADGWQIYAKVRGKFVSKHFPTNTPMKTLRAGLEDLRAAAHLGIQAPAASAGSTTLQADVKEYLKAKAAMPSINDRTQRMTWWCSQLGPRRSRDTVTAIEIRQQLQELIKSGRSSATAKQYYIALHDFYKIMDEGQVAKNPCKTVDRPKEVATVWTLPSLEDAERAIDHATVSRKGPQGKKKIAKPPADQDTDNRARLRVLLWTGWPGMILKKLREKDINWQAETVIVHARLKGGGTRPRTVPLLPQAVKALKAYVALGISGDFSNSSLNKALKRGCARTGVPEFNPYKLRHLLGTTASKLSNDERGVSELMLHSDPRQTRRYTEHAASTRATATISAIKAALPMADQT